MGGPAQSGSPWPGCDSDTCPTSGTANGRGPNGTPRRVPAPAFTRPQALVQLKAVPIARARLPHLPQLSLSGWSRPERHPAAGPRHPAAVPALRPSSAGGPAQSGPMARTPRQLLPHLRHGEMVALNGAPRRAQHLPPPTLRRWSSSKRLPMARARLRHLPHLRHGEWSRSEWHSAAGPGIPRRSQHFACAQPVVQLEVAPPRDGRHASSRPHLRLREWSRPDRHPRLPQHLPSPALRSAGPVRTGLQFT